MPYNTSATEDRLCDECESFGGKAAELVEVVKMLDAMIEEQKTKIENLENEVRELSH